MRETLSEAALYGSLQTDFQRLHRNDCQRACFMPMPTLVRKQHPGVSNWIVEIPGHFSAKCRNDVETLVMDHQARFDVEVK